MTAYATSAMTIVYGCGHSVHLTNGDEFPPACPRCSPVEGSDYRIPDTRYRIEALPDGSHQLRGKVAFT